MNNGSFKGLLCREYYFIKRQIPAMLVMWFITTLFLILIVLSFRFGNLANIEEFKLEHIAESLKLLPVMCAAMIPLSMADSAVNDISPVWERFRRTTPVSSMKFALAKYTVISITIAISVVLAFLTLLAMSKIIGSPITAGDFALTLLMIAFCVVYAITAQLFVTYFKSLDKGMIATMVVMMSVVFLSFVLTGLFKAEGRDTEEINAVILVIKNACVKFAPIMIAVIIVLICGGCYITSLLYKRREK